MASSPVSPDPCPSCRSRSVVHDAVKTSHLAPTQRIVVFACEQCGDWWFTYQGQRLTVERMLALGLIE